ncbi:MAG: sensor histidine kinase [Treponema sp.]|jgi:two-component system sensor histidine kinase YesM|nr:sensor histidine kinase [Treponema sp.]
MKRRRFYSIQVTIAMAIASLSVIIIVGAILIAFQVTEETARISSGVYTRQLVRQITNNIDFYIDYLYSASTILQSDGWVQEYLDAASDSDRDTAAANALPTLRSMITTRQDIALIGIFGFKGGCLLAGPPRGGDDAEGSGPGLNPFIVPEAQSWYEAARNRRGEAVISSSHVQNIIRNQYPWVISLSREISDPETGESKGVLLLDLNFRIIERICSSVQLGRRGYIFIVDRNGEIVYHPQQQLLYSGLKGENIRGILESRQGYFAGEGDDRDTYYSIQTMASTGWKAVAVNYRSEFAENRESIRRTYALWGLIFFTASMLISIVLSRWISKPIMKLRGSMMAVEQGDFGVTADIPSRNEIGELGAGFNIMVAEIKKLLRRVTQEQEQKRKSELNALQMQINPHFLYNTLDSVIWMAEQGKRDEVIDMSSALARLFRISISKGKEIIEVAQEIEHVRSYLTIQKIRYKDKLDYRIEVDEEILHFRIVKIILQPLVENAIYHGVKNAAKSGGEASRCTVTISGFRTGKGMDLIVGDNGAGMSAEILSRIHRRLGGEAPSHELVSADSGSSGVFQPSNPGSGVGIRNVDERIKLYFGGEYGLEFESREDEGTKVFIHLPAISGEEPLPPLRGDPAEVSGGLP